LAFFEGGWEPQIMLTDEGFKGIGFGVLFSRLKIANVFGGGCAYCSIGIAQQYDWPFTHGIRYGIM
jgi:hypothetical protein